MSQFAAQGKEIGRVRVGFDGDPRIREWETKTAFDPGWRLHCELARIDRLSTCGRVDPKTENAVGDERFTARTIDASPNLSILQLALHHLEIRASFSMFTIIFLPVSSFWIHQLPGPNSSMSTANFPVKMSQHILDSYLIVLVSHRVSAETSEALNTVFLLRLLQF